MSEESLQRAGGEVDLDPLIGEKTWSCAQGRWVVHEACLGKGLGEEKVGLEQGIAGQPKIRI